jgi:nitroreductase
LFIFINQIILNIIQSILFSMDGLAAIKNRRSTRKYLEDDVPLDLVGAVVEAGCMAPSAGNQQSWKFVVVKSLDKRKAIAEACLEQYWMSKAPVHIIVVSEDEKIRKMYGVRGEKLYSIQTCAAAIENILIAATDLGLGSCWVSAFEESIISRVLKIPESARPQAIITLGYPDEEPRKKIIQPLERVMHFENYGSRIKEISPFLWNWSSVVEENVTGAKAGLSSVLKKSLEKHRKKLKDKWSKLQKKIDERVRRPV